MTQLRAHRFVALVAAGAAPLLALALARATGSVDAGVPPRDGGTFGRLPPEVIQRIVRANFSRFKPCYTDGLSRNPQLRGCVMTKFVIDPTGHVSSQVDIAPPDAAVPDEVVRKCVVDAFRTLEFPPPEGGIVTVTYPLVFNFGDSNQARCPTATVVDGGAHD